MAQEKQLTKSEAITQLTLDIARTFLRITHVLVRC
jgi:hypothetical protein